MKRLLFLTATILLITSHAYATGKVYAVIMGATQDEKIGNSCKVDLDRFENELNTLACNLDMDRVPTIRYNGDVCDRPHMEEGLQQLKACTQEDIVFFYYSGHGGRAINDKTQWPQLCMNYKDPNNFVPAHEIISKISALPAHLKIVLTDCCNTKHGAISPKFMMANARSATDVSEINYENLAKLFIKQKGTIIGTGSQVDQASIGYENYGGAFTMAFWAALEDAAMGGINPDWDSVFKLTIQYTQKITENKQTPMYQVQTEHNESNSHPTQTQPEVVANSDVNSAMLRDMSKLLDRNIEISSRLRLMSGIIGNYFTSNTARIQTIGRDMHTIVDTEDVETFLRRIAFDKKIRQINVVECKTYSGKCSYLKVHEVRDELQK